MKQKLLATTAAAAAIGALILAEKPALADAAHHPGDAGAATPAQADQPSGGSAAGMMSGQRMMGGMMGPGMGSGMMGGQGMMSGQGMGPGMMGPCGGAGGDKDLSVENVRDILEGHLAWAGNKRLKVGDVTRKDDDTYIAEIVTVDDSLVLTLAVDRTTGAMQPVN